MPSAKHPNPETGKFAHSSFFFFFFSVQGYFVLLGSLNQYRIPGNQGLGSFQPATNSLAKWTFSLRLIISCRRVALPQLRVKMLHNMVLKAD